MKVLVTGARGQLGQDVVTIFQKAGHDVIACDRKELDITDLERSRKVVSTHGPKIIIHCAAYTAVDAAETDVDGAYLVNAVGSRNIALAAEDAQAKLVYISTDYVFDGKGEQSYHEYDNTDPQSIYGKSKRAGEILVQNLCSKWFIVRTSWAFGLYGNNFVKTMLRLGREKPLLQVVHDQTGSPTYTVHLARFLLDLAATEKYGVYHASNSGACTWYEFTEAIMEEARELLGWPITATLEPCTTDQFPRPAPRPANSVMEHLSIRTNGFEDLPHWREGLRQFLLAMRHDPDLYLQ
ncbi:dTDP-4-dehydrorhamnose reductase [Paenibacillus sp. DMB20]|uniref:dTDP-4-dehydrorhamnose reductase n=1 Tax=Paenibacillus sp. DMB20 TaxID=1642570 RepID=UPI0006278BEE|nr:dTDP-4-dehydrorhamnose reductase [Paenibacillus sp. DMB20]KKO54757.1 dTDP-4-dehydrorhamnose reductase [Paenibacillus sp. DMB20]KKO55034.1 dTDP-4-dehydrorhamnose reductase [Paenibacillus sp. DMB20]